MPKHRLEIELNNLIKNNSSIFLLLEQCSSDGIWFWDLENPKEKWMSPKFWKTLGYSLDEKNHLISKWRDIINPDDLKIVLHNLNQLLKNPDFLYDQIIRYRGKNGNTVWIRCRGMVIYNDEGTPIRMIGTHDDLTQQKRKEKELQESNFRWHFGIEGIGEGLWDWNLEDNSIYFSSQWKKILGFSKDEIENNFDEFKSRVYPKHLDIIFKNLKDYINGLQKEFNVEFQMLTKCGKYKWIQARGSIVKRDNKGNPLRMIGRHRDIDDIKSLTTRVDKSNDRFIDMFQLHSTIMLLIDPKTLQILDANQSALKFYGYTYFEMTSMTMQQIHLQSEIEIEQKRQETLQFHKSSFSALHRLKDGSVRIVNVNSTSIYSNRGKLFCSIIQDITREKEYEKELKKNLSFFESLISTIPDPIFYKDINGVYKSCNSAFSENIFGLPPNLIIGKTIFDFPEYISHQQANFFKKKDDELVHLHKSTQIYQADILCPNEVVKRFQFHRAVIHDSNNTPLGIVGTLRDITALYQTEIELIKKTIQLENVASTDYLTNIYNRRKIDEILNIEIARSERYKKSLGICLLDIDNFKKVNDIYGHQEGDKILKSIALLLQQNIRKSDYIGRWGGEEFLIIFPEANDKSISCLSEKLRVKIMENNFDTVGQITASFGVSKLCIGDDIQSLVKKSDKALYQAKKEGKNRVVLFS